MKTVVCLFLIVASTAAFRGLTFAQQKNKHAAAAGTSTGLNLFNQLFGEAPLISPDKVFYQTAQHQCRVEKKKRKADAARPDGGKSRKRGKELARHKMRKRASLCIALYRLPTLALPRLALPRLA
jgi:hypothetical protein